MEDALSRSRYTDRGEAGRVLSEALAGRVAPPCVVAGIPRGGALVALPIARALGCALGLAFARKVSAEAAPELAIGAMDEDGRLEIDPDIAADLHVSPAELGLARERVLAEIERQKRIFDAPDLAALLPGRTLVLVDDGLATGATMRAAIAFARRHGAQRIVVAVPYAAAETAGVVRESVDDLVCPWSDPAFLAVGAAYLDFRPVRDEEVREALALARAAARTRGE